MFYFRDKEKREIDFVIVKNNTPEIFIETKVSEKTPVSELFYTKRKFPKARHLQVVLNCDSHHDKDGVEIINAKRFLSELAV